MAVPPAPEAGFFLKVVLPAAVIVVVALLLFQ